KPGNANQSGGSEGSSSGSTSSGSTSSGSTSTAAPAWPGRQYFQGDYSDSLKVWQRQAGKLGYGLVGTGYFGPKTEHAVLEIQKRAGLNVVGFIGPKTWAAAWSLAGESKSGSSKADESTSGGSTTEYT